MANIRMLPSTFLTSTPLIKVISEGEKQSHIVGTNPHDQFILGNDGGLHYYNLQCCASTEYGEYKFDVKVPDNNYEEITFDKVDFIDLMNLDAERFGLEDGKEYLELKSKIEELFKAKMYQVEAEKQERIEKYILEHFDDIGDECEDI